MIQEEKRRGKDRSSNTNLPDASVQRKTNICSYAVDMGGGKSAVGVYREESPTLACTHYGEPVVAYRADGASGGGDAFAIVGDHDNRITDLTDIICYGISPYHSNAMRSKNPHSGIYEADTARTLDANNCGNPACNEGGIVICQLSKR